jgi:sulfur relay (sulfurtransferase) DsrC/TusE family protein
MTSPLVVAGDVDELEDVGKAMENDDAAYCEQHGQWMETMCRHLDCDEEVRVSA